MSASVFLAVFLSLSQLTAVGAAHGDDFEDFANGVLGELGATGFECPDLLHTDHCAFYGSADFSKFRTDWKRVARERPELRSLRPYTAWKKEGRIPGCPENARRFYKVYRSGNDLLYVFFDRRWQTVSILYPPSRGDRDQPGPWVGNTMGVSEPERIYEDTRRWHGPVLVDVTATVLRDGTVGEIITVKGNDRAPPGAENETVERAHHWRFKPALRHGTPVEAYVLDAAFFESTDAAERPSQEQRVEPGEIYVGWGVSREGHYLTRSSTSVLSFTVSDPGREYVIDDEGWYTALVEIPDLDSMDLPLVVEAASAFLVSCNVWAHCAYQGLVAGRIALFERTEAGVRAELDLEFEHQKIRGTAEFSPGRPPVDRLLHVPILDYLHY